MIKQEYLGFFDCTSRTSPEQQHHWYHRHNHQHYAWFWRLIFPCYS